MAQYLVEVSLDNLALFLMRDRWIGRQELSALANLDVKYALMVHDVQRLVEIDFTPLCSQRIEYEAQKCITRERVTMMAVCAVHYDLALG